MILPALLLAALVGGDPTGAVSRWRRGDAGFEHVTGTDLPGNNGIGTDPDDRHFDVVAFGCPAVVVFDRSAAAPVARIEARDFMPDNIHLTGGRPLLAGIRLDEPACGGRRRIVEAVADPMPCHRGWTVSALDVAHRRIDTVAAGGPLDGFNGPSGAAIADGALWPGSFQASRLAIVRDWSAARP